MDLIDGMRCFSQVVATGSFTRAAERLGVSKKLVSKYVAELENRLGARLLHRTTRSLSLTETGALYHARCVQLLDDLEELEQSVQKETASPRGRLYVSAPSTFGEMYLVPQITAFREIYPEVTIDLRLNDRYVNLVEEGFDVAIRIGTLESSGLIARRLAPARVLVCAAPAYLQRAGIPEQPRDLEHHDCILDTNLRSGNSWRFLTAAGPTSVTVSGSLAVNSARSARDIALRGGGIALCPSYVVGPDIAAGRLVPLLADFSSFGLSVYAVYNTARNLAPKVRVFIDFLAEAFKGEPEWDGFDIPADRG